MQDETSAREQEIRAAQFRQSMNRRLEELLKAGYSLLDLAELLGAQEFLSYQHQGRQGSPVLRLDVKGFVDFEIESGRFLRLPDQIFKLDEVILPPGEGHILAGKGKGESFEPRGRIPRGKYLIDVLSELDKEYYVIEGETDTKMLRKESYRIFVVPGLQKMIFVNDEEGNATFIMQDQYEGVEQWREKAKMTKNKIKQSISNLTTVRYKSNPEEWKEAVKKALITPYESIKGMGWKINRHIAKRLGFDRTTTASIAEKYRGTHPNWFRKDFDPRGYALEFFHPDLIAEIEKELQGLKPAPEGWLTRMEIAAELAVDYATVDRFVEKYAASKPEWLHRYVSKNNQFREHLHPVLLNLVRNEIGRRENAPERWLTNIQLASALQVSKGTTRRVIERHRETHSSWFHRYRGLGGKMAEYLHPDLIQLVMSEFDIRRTVPVGWLTRGEVAYIAKVDRKTVSKIAEKFRGEHPDWFHDYYDKANRYFEHLHPDLVKTILSLKKRN